MDTPRTTFKARKMPLYKFFSLQKHSPSPTATRDFDLLTAKRGIQRQQGTQDKSTLGELISNITLDIEPSDTLSFLHSDSSSLIPSSLSKVGRIQKYKSIKKVRPKALTEPVSPRLSKRDFKRECVYCLMKEE